MNQNAEHSRSILRRRARLPLVVGVVAIGISVLVARGETDLLLGAYLVNWLFLFGLCLGSLALAMIHHLTGGAWGILVRRILEAQMRTLPLIILLFLPIAFGARHVYPWAAGKMPGSPELAFRAWYLEPSFLWWRSVAYFVLWLAMTWLLSRWSTEEDTVGARAAWKCQGLSGPGLVVYGVTLHFAAIDWMMSLVPSFTSTIYAPIVAAGQLLSALALAIVVFALLSNRPPFAAALSGKASNDLGNLLLTLVLVSAYLIWCQAMLTWMADLRHDNTWWLARTSRLWQAVVNLLFLLGFVTPLLILLFRAVKQHPRRLKGVAILLLVIQYALVVYQIVPGTPFASIATLWLAPLLLLGLGGLWLAAFLRLLASRPLTPLADRNWNHARHLQHLDQEELARQEVLAHE